ncbi:MAG: hypothetical protein N4A39_03015 [Roseicyclus sp.]|jgi:hypothetical protein|nr:hypothetical protein [Roseicyclus sp.]
MTETSVSTPDPASELPLVVLIGRVLWQMKWLLLLASAPNIALAELGYESAGSAAFIYGYLFVLSFDVARHPEITIPRDWTFRPAILLPILLVLVVGFITAGLLLAGGASSFMAINSVNVMIAVTLAALGPWLVRFLAPERTRVRIGLFGRLWRLGVIAGLGVVWSVLSLLVIAYGVPDAPGAIAIPVGILLRAVADAAIVAHATVLVAAVGPEDTSGITEISDQNTRD